MGNTSQNSLHRPRITERSPSSGFLRRVGVKAVKFAVKFAGSSLIMAAGTVYGLGAGVTHSLDPYSIASSRVAQISAPQQQFMVKDGNATGAVVVNAQNGDIHAVQLLIDNDQSPDWDVNNSSTSATMSVNGGSPQSCSVDRIEVTCGELRTGETGVITLQAKVSPQFAKTTYTIWVRDGDQRLTEPPLSGGHHRDVPLVEITELGG